MEQNRLPHITDGTEERMNYADQLVTEVRAAIPNAPQDGALAEQALAFAETAVGYKELCMIYTCAIKEIRTKFDVLNAEFSVRYSRNPIYCISTRLKSTVSILQKLKKQNLPLSLASIENNLHDVAGVRVVCSYTDDIYRIAESLLRQNDIQLLQTKDYIANPKSNGYRSLHLIVSVPVFFAEKTKAVQVEVQIRTIAMDYWASLEHQLRYKHDIQNAQAISAELKQCADTIAQTDERMLSLRQQIDEQNSTSDGDERLLDKLSRLDVSLR